MLEHILLRLREWEHLGTRADPSGSRLVAHIPRDFPLAYLHSFFAPISPAEMAGCGLVLPGQLQALYRECNGLFLFAGSLAIFGVRAHHMRDVSAQFQPFDLVMHHSESVHVRHRGSEKQFDRPVFFGVYYNDGSGLMMTHSSPKVYRLLRGSTVAVNEWPDLRTFLDTEYDRLDRLFTRSGYLRDQHLVTTPDEDNR